MKSLPDSKLILNGPDYRAFKNVQLNLYLDTEECIQLTLQTPVNSLGFTLHGYLPNIRICFTQKRPVLFPRLETEERRCSKFKSASMQMPSGYLAAANGYIFHSITQCEITVRSRASWTDLTIIGSFGERRENSNPTLEDKQFDGFEFTAKYPRGALLAACETPETEKFVRGQIFE